MVRTGKGERENGSVFLKKEEQGTVILLDSIGAGPPPPAAFILERWWIPEEVHLDLWPGGRSITSATETVQS